MRDDEPVSLFKRKPQDSPAAVSTPAPTFAQVIGQLATTAGPSVTARSDFVKKVDCGQCGGTKRLPSVTSYLYCDYCGALMDYDFRTANADTNAGLTNTVYHHLAAPWQIPMAAARASGDAESLRTSYRAIFSEWVKQCPQAVSPRCANDDDFRDRMVTYLVESAVNKDLDPDQASLDAEMQMRTNALVRVPMGTGAWRVQNGFWEVAELFKKQMELAYARLDAAGVLALDPDQAPSGVPLRMEYSTFCQGWLPHLSEEEGEKLLEMYGLSGEYEKYEEIDTDSTQCGGCGAQLKTVPGASAVICDGCGRKLDIGGGTSPCSGCGAPLTFPLGVNRLTCPYCQQATSRA
jgi:DNA-directed RNA polymerase subunit RPC12/RpoP